MTKRPSKSTRSSSVACACDQPTGRGTPGRRPAVVDSAVKSASVRHLRRIEGQVRGLAKMVETDRTCPDIITQVTAVRESLQSVAKQVLRNHLSLYKSKQHMKLGTKKADAMYEELVDLVGKICG